MNEDGHGRPESEEQPKRARPAGGARPLFSMEDDSGGGKSRRLVAGFLLFALVGAVVAGAIWAAGGPATEKAAEGPPEALREDVSVTQPVPEAAARGLSQQTSERRIVFVSTDSGTERLYVVDARGSVLPVNATDGRESTPAWSRDGKKLAFAAYKNATTRAPGGVPELWVINADGSGSRVLTRAGDLQPSWSPDGARLVFASGENSGPSGALQLFIAGAGGSPRSQVSIDANLAHGAPSWSPVDNRIAFHGRTPGSSDSNLYILDIDSRRAVRLTDHPASDETPSWSPDGSRLVFASSRSGNFDIYEINADGSGLRQLTFGPARETFPTYSPDGSSIAYVSASGGDSQVFLMNPDGSNQRQLTRGPGTKSYLTW